MCDTLLEDCSICLEHIINDDIKQKTECHHTFHADCLTRWTQANNSCPLCRTPIHSTIQTRQDIINASQNGLYMPLSFWFNRDEHLIMPEVAFEHTTIDISFAELSDLTIENDNENQLSFYSFALEPEEYQPSGSSMVSRIDDTRLNYLTVPFNLFPESNEPSGSGNGSRVAY